MLMLPIVTVDLNTFPLHSVPFGLIYFETMLLGVEKLRTVISSYWTDLSLSLIIFLALKFTLPDTGRFI